MNSRLLWLSLLLTLCFGTAPLQARYLNANTGRFQTMDSYEGSASEPASLHKYLYALNDPVDRVDPSGKESSASGAVTVGGGFGVIGSIQLPALRTVLVRAGEIAATVALTKRGDPEGNYVYRRLSDAQARTQYRSVGIYASNPAAIDVTPDMHIGDGFSHRNSPWISTSKNFLVPAKWYLNEFNIANPIVKIDLARVGGRQLDFTNPLILATLRTSEAIANASRDSEVLIFGYVPPFAIVASYDGRRLIE